MNEILPPPQNTISRYSISQIYQIMSAFFRRHYFYIFTYFHVVINNAKNVLIKTTIVLSKSPFIW